MPGRLKQPTKLTCSPSSGKPPGAFIQSSDRSLTLRDCVRRIERISRGICRVPVTCVHVIRRLERRRLSIRLRDCVPPVNRALTIRCNPIVTENSVPNGRGAGIDWLEVRLS